MSMEQDGDVVFVRGSYCDDDGKLHVLWYRRVSRVVAQVGLCGSNSNNRDLYSETATDRDAHASGHVRLDECQCNHCKTTRDLAYLVVSYVKTTYETETTRQVYCEKLRVRPVINYRV